MISGEGDCIYSKKPIGGVSIVTSTNRPHFFNRILENYNAQLYKTKQLIIILNKDNMNLSKYRKIAHKYKNVQVYQLPERVSLGKCLNFAINKSTYPYITKFDDDDYYSPYYLKEQIKAIRRTGADLVGKKAILNFLESSSKLIIRFPNQQNKYTGLVAGGTILFKRQVFRNVRFANVSIGEDVNFLRRCRTRGYRIYATSPKNYVYIRRKDKMSHTWKVSERYILHKSLLVARTKRFHRYAIQRY
ncbi:glycosyltransferase [Paenibacillus sp. PR3]|uniref:Glycosyltransferase n=1 Tax=Paenibacillus terricola TaxID=2763503 RepID=A0ABR8MVK4_9BACL|nr:glycosyltransferase [Paenibacillus terricola]MBD3919101.1 glycosyltransferase [Paenibacillus terricola]